MHLYITPICFKERIIQYIIELYKTNLVNISSTSFYIVIKKREDYEQNNKSIHLL